MASTYEDQQASKEKHRGTHEAGPGNTGGNVYDGDHVARPGGVPMPPEPTPDVVLPQPKPGEVVSIDGDALLARDRAVRASR